MVSTPYRSIQCGTRAASIPPAGTGNEGDTGPSGPRSRVLIAAQVASDNRQPRRGDRAHGAEACGKRVDHDAAAAGAPRCAHTLRHDGRDRRDVREIQRVPPRLAVGPRDRFLAALDPLAKRRRRLIRQAVVIFDEIDPRSGESIGQLCELRGREAERLERRAEQGSATGARELTEPHDAEPRAAQLGEQPVGPLETGDHDPCLERDVAEQEVQELWQVTAHNRRIERDHDARATAAERLDRLDVSRDPPCDLRRNGVRRELDGLLERDVLRPRGGEPARAGEVIRHAQAHGDRGHAGC